MIVYLTCVVLMLIGIYCIAVKKNIIKIIVGIIIMEYAINLFLVAQGFRGFGIEPNPLPQSLALIAITIGLATTVITVAIAIRIYDRYGTLNITEIRKLKG